MSRHGDSLAGGESQARVSKVFMGLYALAHLGAFIAFVPMLNILLPLKAEAIDPAGKATLLSQAALWGAVAASVANVAAGALSDATRCRFGRRRPWIIVGVLMLVAAYALVYSADGAAVLIAAVLLFQLATNVMFAPLNAVLPDRVPRSQKGLMSALMGLAAPGAGLFAAFFVAMAFDDLGARFAVVAGAVVLCILPFPLLLREPPVTAGPAAPVALIWRGGLPAAFRDRDFQMAFLSGLLVQVSITLNALYLLFYLQEAAPFDAPFAPRSAEAALGWLLAAGTATGLVAGLVGGVLSDRLGRRKVFVMTGGLAMAAAATLMAVAPVWPAPLLAQILFGAGLGLYTTMSIALIAEVLPDPAASGRDLGLMNLAMTTSQIIGPLVGLTLLSVGGSVIGVFAVSGVFGLGGAMAVMAVRRVR